MVYEMMVRKRKLFIGKIRVASGFVMPERSFSTDAYRYGFNDSVRVRGAAKKPLSEWKGEGNSYDYGFRVHDARLGRFLSVDPLAGEYPWYTPYQFAGNKSIEAIDLDGAEEVFVVYSPMYSPEVYRLFAEGKTFEGSRLFMHLQNSRFQDVNGNENSWFLAMAKKSPGPILVNNHNYSADHFWLPGTATNSAHIKIFIYTEWIDPNDPDRGVEQFVIWKYIPYEEEDRIRIEPDGYGGLHFVGTGGDNRHIDELMRKTSGSNETVDIGNWLTILKGIADHGKSGPNIKKPIGEFIQMLSEGINKAKESYEKGKELRDNFDDKYGGGSELLPLEEGPGKDSAHYITTEDGWRVTKYGTKARDKYLRENPGAKETGYEIIER